MLVFTVNQYPYIKSLKSIEGVVNEQLKYVQSIVVALIAFIGLVLATVGIIVCLTSCTLNMIMTHTEGSASDIVDSDPENSPKVSPQISVPLSSIP